MAYLLKCPLCGRNVSSEAESCPGCGHNVAAELQERESNRKEELEKQGLCPECKGRDFSEYKKPRYHATMNYQRHECDDIFKRCNKCGWTKHIGTTNWSM